MPDEKIAPIEHKPESIQDKIQRRYIDSINAIFDSRQGDSIDLRRVKAGLVSIFNNPIIKEKLSGISAEDITQSLDACATEKSRGAFRDCMLKAIKPLTDFHLANPQIFEDIEAQVSMEAAGFTPLNERISYGIYKDTIHIHLAPSFTVKEQLPQIFGDAMLKLAKIVKDHPEISQITGTSWVLATKTFGPMLAGVGFNIVDVPEAIRREHFANESRPIKTAIMSREDFLARFGQ